MKNNLLTLATILTIGFFTNSAIAQTTATGDTEIANAGATIIQQITLAKDADLNFGTIMTTGTAGTVTLGTDGVRTATGPLLSSVGTAATNAAYSVTGASDATYAITFPADFDVTLISGTATMNINTFTAEFLDNTVGNDVGGASGTLSSVGEDSFKLGATIDVDANQVAGVYTGTFNISVDYN